MNPVESVSQKIAKRASEGFTLIELMTVVAILAIMASMAAPSFTEAILSNRLNGMATDLAAGITQARSEAIKRNITVSLCMSANGSTCTTSGNWAQGWVIRAGTTVLSKQAAASSGFKISSLVSQVDLNPTGVGATSTTFLICRTTPAGSQERKVTVTTTGRAYIEKTRDGSCP